MFITFTEVLSSFATLSSHSKDGGAICASVTIFLSARLTRTAESLQNRGAGRRALPLNEFRTNRRRQWRLRLAQDCSKF